MENQLTLTKAQNAVLSHDWGTAARLYKEMLKSDENNIIYLKALGSVYVKSGEDEKAIPYYEKITNIYPHDVEAMNSLGAIYRRIKKYDKSVEILQKAQKEQNIPSVNYNLGFTFKEMKKFDEAIDAFESVITENPDDVLAYNHLGSIYLEQKNFEKSINSYKRGLQVDPNHPILNYNLANCYAQANNYAEAIRYYEKALKTRPGWVDAVRQFSNILVKCQKSEEAQNLVEKTIKMHPQDADLLCILGRIFLSQFDYENASKTFQKAEEIKPNDIQILMGFSEALEKGEKIEEALEKAVEAAEISPLNPDVRKRYIHTLLSAQKYDQAFEHVQELENEQGSDLQVLDLYGQYYICRGDETLANHYYNQIKEINKDYNDYILNASDRFIQVGNLDKAEEYAKQYVQKKNNHVEGYNQLGEIYLAKGEFHKAKDVLEKSKTIKHPNIIAKKRLERVNEEIQHSPEIMNMPSFDFSSLQKEDDIIAAQAEDEENVEVVDISQDNSEMMENLEALAISGSESDSAEKLEDSFEKNDETENIESGGVIYDENLFDDENQDLLKNDLSNLTDNISEDDENFWSDFEDKTDDSPDLDILNNDEEYFEPEDDFDDSYIEENKTFEPVTAKNDAVVQEKPIVQEKPVVQKVSSPVMADEQLQSPYVQKMPENMMNSVLNSSYEIAQRKVILEALDSADIAMKMAVETQQKMKDLEEKQIEFEKEVAAKNEQFMKDALNKIESESEAGGQEQGEQELSEQDAECEFGDVGEFVQDEQELSEQDAECEFGDVGEFVQDEQDEECEFGDVCEFVQDEQELGEQDEECEFGDVDEFAEQGDSVEESGFAEVGEFVQDEQELSEQDAECEFGDVGEFAEADDSAEESEFAEVGEFVGDEQETPLSCNDFTNLRNIFDYLPENGRDTFVSNRIRMVVEYVIAKTSGKRGLLKTAKMWRKNAYEDPLVNTSEEDKVTAKEICDLLEYLKTLANNLEDKDISKAICESADNVIQRINY